MLQIDNYAYNNRLRDVHPVEKAIFSFGFLLFSLISKHVLVAFITFFVMSAITVIYAKIPLKYYVKLLLLPFFFLFTSVLAILISISPSEAVIKDLFWQWQIGNWQFYISSYNISQVVNLIYTVTASISCMYFFVLTTPIQQIIWLLQKLKVPALFIELSVFTYRFIFVLLEKMHEIFLAQSSRLGYQNYRGWISSLGQLVVGLYIKSMRSAKELQVALDSRGGTEGLYEVNTTHEYKSMHWVALALSMTLFVFILIFT